MELIQQLEEWQRQLDEATDAAHADLDVAKRLVKHGADALREIKRLRAAESWIRAQAAKYPTKPSAGSTYSAGFDVGYALAMEQAARTFDAAPNAKISGVSAAGDET